MVSSAGGILRKVIIIYKDIQAKGSQPGTILFVYILSEST